MANRMISKRCEGYTRDGQGPRCLKKVRVGIAYRGRVACDQHMDAVYGNAKTSTPHVKIPAAETQDAYSLRPRMEFIPQLTNTECAEASDMIDALGALRWRVPPPEQDERGVLMMAWEDTRREVAGDAMMIGLRTMMESLDSAELD